MKRYVLKVKLLRAFPFIRVLLCLFTVLALIFIYNSKLYLGIKELFFGEYIEISDGPSYLEEKISGNNVNFSRVAENIMENNMLKNVAFQIKYPKKIKLIVEEYPAEALYEYMNERFVVSSGKIIKITNKESLPLTLLGKDAYKKYKKVYDNLIEQGLSIKEMEYIDTNRWDVFLDSGIVVKLPMKSAESAIIYLPKILTWYDKLKLKHEVIDMREYPIKIAFFNE